MSRVPLVCDDHFDPIVELAAAFLKARGAELPDLYRLLANTPDLLKGWMDMMWPLRDAKWIPTALREILIMDIALLQGARYDWCRHWPTALSAGIAEEKLLALRKWRQSELFDGKERAALEFAEGVFFNGRVPNEIYENFSKYFTAPEIVAIGVTAALYSGIVRFTQAFELGPEPSHEAFGEMLR